MKSLFSTGARLHQESEVRVLRFLWSSRAEWSGREIARQVGLSAPSCHEVLKKLYARSFVLFRRVSNVHLYKINHDNHMVQNLFARLFEAEAAIPGQIANLIKKSLVNARQPDIVAIILFGSMARGRERAGSDLDLLIAVDAKESLKVLEPRIEKLRTILSRRFGVPLAPYVQTLSQLRRKHQEKLPLIGEIIKDGRSIYGKSIGELLS